MKLRGRLILAVSITLLVVLLANVGGLQVLLSKSLHASLDQMGGAFANIEDQQLDQDLRRLQDAYQEEILQVEKRLLDWAQWDDSWNFMKSRNPDFISSNLSSDVVQAMDYDAILFITQNGQVIAATLSDSNLIPIDSIYQKLAVAQMLEPFIANDDVRSGQVKMGKTPALFAIRPITPTSGEGENRGMVVFVKLFTPNRVQNLADRLHLNIHLKSCDAQNPQPQQSYPIIDKSDATWIHAAMLIRDALNKPSFEFHIQVPRKVQSQSLETQAQITEVFQGMFASNAFGAVLGALANIIVLVLILNRFLLGKFRTLSNTVEKIRKESDHSLRIPDLGKDEVGELGSQFNEMLHALQLVQNTMQQQGKVRKALLDALPMPIVALNGHFQVAGELSRMGKKVMGEEALGKAWTEVLGLNETQSASLLDFLDVFALGLLSPQDMAALNPITEIQIRGLWLRLTYHPLPHQENTGEALVILVVAEDISEEKRHQDEMRKLSADNAWLKAILADPDLFVEFFRESRQGLDVVQQVLSSHIEESEIARAFRHVHTLQGCSSGFGLMDLSQAASKLEDQLSRILRAVQNPHQTGHLKSEAEEKARFELDNLLTVLTTEQQRLLGALNQQVSDWKSGPSLRIPLHRLTEWSALLAMGDRDEVLHSIEARLRVPLSRVLNRTLVWFPGMVRRSSKQAELQLIGSDIPIPIEWSTSLNDILVHLLRNAMAHGIEYPEERTLRGKSEAGHIQIQAKQQDQILEFWVSDDGAGFSIEVEQAFSLGASSRENTDTLSGRGVGLHAVKTMVEELGGTITVESSTGKGATFHLRFDLSPVF